MLWHLGAGKGRGGGEKVKGSGEEERTAEREVNTSLLESEKMESRDPQSPLRRSSAKRGRRRSGGEVETSWKKEKQDTKEKTNLRNPLRTCYFGRQRELRVSLNR